MLRYGKPLCSGQPVSPVLAQIHRKGLATVREGRMRGAGSRRRGLDPLQSGWAQGVIATPRGC